MTLLLPFGACKNLFIQNVKNALVVRIVMTFE